MFDPPPVMVAPHTTVVESLTVACRPLLPELHGKEPERVANVAGGNSIVATPAPVIVIPVGEITPGAAT